MAGLLTTRISKRAAIRYMGKPQEKPVQAPQVISGFSEKISQFSKDMAKQIWDLYDIETEDPIVSHRPSVYVRKYAPKEIVDKEKGKKDIGHEWLKTRDPGFGKKLREKIVKDVHDTTETFDDNGYKAELKNIFEEIRNFTSSTKWELGRLLSKILGPQSIKRFDSVDKLAGFLEKELSLMIINNLAGAIRRPIANLLRLRNLNLIMENITKIAEVIKKATGMDIDSATNLVNESYMKWEDGTYTDLASFEKHMSEKLFEIIAKKESSQAAEDSKTEINPKILASLDPRSYVFKHEYHKDPKLADVTEFMLRKIISHDPGRFFSLSFDQVPEFADLTMLVAEKLLKHDFMSFIVKQRLHRNHKFVGLLPELWNQVVRFVGSPVSSEMLKGKGIMEKELTYVVKQLSQHHPQYFIESGLAEDEEFGRFFENIGRKACMIRKLVKVANQMDRLQRFGLANRIDTIIETVGG